MDALRNAFQPSSGRFATIQVMPTRSSSYAESAVRTLNKGLVLNPRARGIVVTERVVEHIAVETVDHPWLYEQLTEGANGSSSIKYVAGTVDAAIHVVTAGSESRDGGWPWEDVVQVASAQSQKLKRLIERHDV